MSLPSSTSANADEPEMGAAGPKGSSVFARPKVADRILSTLRAEILSGVLPRNSKLPTERDLATRFGVSGPTVREAIRGLSALGLVEVRHGSGAYVLPNVDSIVAVSLGTLVQLESVGLTDLIALLKVLNSYAAELAVERASDEDVAALRAAAHRTITCKTVEETAAALTGFLTTLADASYDPLLRAIARFLVQLVVTLELSSHMMKSNEFWQRWSSSAGSLRLAIVERLEERDRDGMVEAVVRYHTVIAERIESIPELKAARLSDADFETLISPRSPRS